MAPLLIPATSAGTVGLFGIGGSFSLAATAATVGTAGAVASAFGAFPGASGSGAELANAQSQKNIAEYNAQVAEQEGKAARARAGFEQERQAGESQRIKSSQIAALGAAGAVGSSIDINIAREQERESTLENLLIGYEGEVLSLRAGNAATLSRLQGEAALRAGQSQAKSKDIGFGIQLAGLTSRFT